MDEEKMFQIFGNRAYEGCEKYREETGEDI